MHRAQGLASFIATFKSENGHLVAYAYMWLKETYSRSHGTSFVVVSLKETYSRSRGTSFVRVSLSPIGTRRKKYTLYPRIASLVAPNVFFFFTFAFFREHLPRKAGLYISSGASVLWRHNIYDFYTRTFLFFFLGEQGFSSRKEPSWFLKKRGNQKKNTTHCFMCVAFKGALCMYLAFFLCYKRGPC